MANLTRILNYQDHDHLTKWLVLLPLERKCALEVYNALTSIFYILGVPNILQCDKGK